MPIIEVEHVTKEFRLGQFRTLRQSLSKLAARLRGGEVAERAPFKALDGVSFTVEPGEVVGIIGQNGAGKSTLLKMLAAISKPTRGRVAVHGKVAPLIEVGAGLVPDLTGRENIRLNATILGMKRTEIDRNFDDIVAFAELEEFIDTPVKRYSSGMQVRLGFSIATSVQADILIVDEVLAVGDLAFQRKCFDRMEKLIRSEGRTVLMVSHNIRQIERLCQRALLLDHGRMVADGQPALVCDEFYARSNSAIARSKAKESVRSARVESIPEFQLLGIELLDKRGRGIGEAISGADLSVALRIRCEHALSNLIFGLGIHTTDFVYLTTHSSESNARRFDLLPGESCITCTIARLPLLPGVYQLRIGVSDQSGAAIFYGESLCQLRVASPEDAPTPAVMREGVFLLSASWEAREPRALETVLE